MTGDTQRVVPGEPQDAEHLSEVVAAAFHPLAVSQWLIAHPLQRRKIFPGYFRILVEHALACGTIDTTPERTAAALWLPVDANGPQAPDDYDKRLKAAVGTHVQRFEALDGQFAAHHPTGSVHHHLAILAVHPDHQGHGLGRALLTAHHRLLDQAGMPAYLEASDEANRAWYARHGYTDHEAPLALPGGPSLYPMWREPT